MPSLEMLKKLLDEFSEKEAHTREEINVITEQIGELEKRILTSQQKLSTVAADREKVRAMQARYSGNSTLTPGTPLMGSSPSASDPGAEEVKEKEPRPRPGRASSLGAALGVSESSTPATPVNVRSSSTRIPAMSPPEPVAVPTPPTTPVVPEPVSSASPFLSPPETPVAHKAFSPLDLFGSAADEPQAPAAAPPETPPAAPDYTAGVPYNAGVSYDYQNAQPIEPIPTATPAPALASNPTPVPATPPASSNASAVGEITTSFFTPMGSTEATLQPSTPLTQPEISSQPSLFLDPNQQPQAAQTDENAQVQDLDDDEPDDTVKSINDALRGLFR